MRLRRARLSRWVLVNGGMAQEPFHRPFHRPITPTRTLCRFNGLRSPIRVQSNTSRPTILWDRPFPSVLSPPPPSSSPPPPLRAAEIKGWSGPKEDGYTATWRGLADASGRTPRGHGVLVCDYNNYGVCDPVDGDVLEGGFDEVGRRQGQWVRKYWSGRGETRVPCISTYYYVDDVVVDTRGPRGVKARATPHPPPRRPCACYRGGVRAQRPDQRARRPDGRTRKRPPGGMGVGRRRDRSGRPAGGAGGRIGARRARRAPASVPRAFRCRCVLAPILPPAGTKTPPFPVNSRRFRPARPHFGPPGPFTAFLAVWRPCRLRSARRFCCAPPPCSESYQARRVPPQSFAAA
jgi:hypothetical protein